MKDNKIFNFVKHTLFPRDITCDICGKDVFSSIPVCDECLKKLPYNNNKICSICGSPILSMADVCDRCQSKERIYLFSRTPLIYRDEASLLIKKFKYDNHKYLAKFFAYFMAQTYLKNNYHCDLIIPVPLHIKRLKERGFNQAKLLCDELSKLVKVETRDDILLRVKQTKTQTKLSYTERQQNLDNAFKAVNKKFIKDKNILVVDDVFTTGATIENCAKMLKNSGAGNIFGLCACHTYLNS